MPVPTENVVVIQSQGVASVIQTALRGEMGTTYRSIFIDDRDDRDDGYVYEFHAQRTGASAVLLWQSSNAPGYDNDDDEDGYEVTLQQFVDQLMPLIQGLGEDFIKEEAPHLDIEWIKAKAEEIYAGQ